jgi:D-arabinose 1-dehydrogenase-like Zn-dependent alcohol dehydrogenase
MVRAFSSRILPWQLLHTIMPGLRLTAKSSMNAVRLIKPGQPLESCELPIPVPGPSDVLIRIKAAGVCHSDAHYRAGKSPVHPLPLTLGHEVAGVIESIGSAVQTFEPGDRVCVHYLATCGACGYCDDGNEQFCGSAAMIGKYRDGGYAEFLVMPARSVFPLPPEIPFEQGAIMMCSSATSLHGLRKARLRPGESVAVFGAGGLGLSAIQLAAALGAETILAVDIRLGNLDMAERLGAVPIDAGQTNPVQEIRRITNGRGVDVALELIGLPLTMTQAVQSLGIKGRAAIVGITDKSFEVAPYRELINKEAEVIGVSDHLASEMPSLIDFARTGKLSLGGVITRTLSLEADAINGALDRFERFEAQGREVVVP